MKDARQRRADPDWAKRHYVQVYEAAAAQVDGRPPPHQITFHGPPQVLMKFAVIRLVTRFSAAEAARLLRLTETQVSAIAGAVRKVDR